MITTLDSTQQLLQQEKKTSSLAAKEKENHLLMLIQRRSETRSHQHSKKKIPCFLGFILCLCLLLHGPASWLSSFEFKNRVWEKISIDAKSAQNLVLQPTELQQTKINLDYDVASGSSVYCNGDPVNGLDPDGRCKQGLNDGFGQGNGHFAGIYNPSSANNQTVYNLAWGVGADVGDFNAIVARPFGQLSAGVAGLALYGLNTAVESTENFLGGPGAGGAIGFMAPLMALEMEAAAAAPVTAEGVANNVAVRKMYLNQLNEIPAQINASLPIREQAIQAFNLRNTAKAEARAMMTDRKAAALLDQVDPISTIQNIVHKVYKEKGLVGDDLWKSILESSTRSRSSVNQALGVGN